MACAKPWFWEKLHSAAAEHAELALEFKVPPNSRPHVDWKDMKSPSSYTRPKDLSGYKVESSQSQANVKEAKQDRINKSHSATSLQGNKLAKPVPAPLTMLESGTTYDNLSKSQSATLRQGSNFAKPTPPPPVLAHRPDAPVPARFQPQALGLLPKSDQRLPDRQQTSKERPRNDLILNQPSMDRQGRSHSNGTLNNFRQEKNMKDTRNLLAALVQPLNSEKFEASEPSALPYHMQRFGKLGDRMQSGTDADVRQLLSGVASFHKPKKDAKQDIYAASTQPGSIASSFAGSSTSSPRQASKAYFA